MDTEATRAVEELCRRLWDFMLEESPQLGTYLGFPTQEDRVDLYAEHRYVRKADFCRTLLADLDSIQAASLTPSAAMSLTMVRYYADICLKGIACQMYLQPVNYFEGPDTWFRLDIVQQMTLATQSDYMNYLSRLRAFADQVDEVREVLKIGLERGRVQHRGSLVNVSARISDLIKSPIEDVMFYQPLIKMPDSFSDDVKIVFNATREKYRTEAKTIITSRIREALSDLKDFIDKEYIPGCRTGTSVCATPGGVELYQMLIRYFADVDWTPQKIHDLGKSEVTRLQARISNVMRKVNFKGFGLADFVRHLQTKEELVFTTTEEMISYMESVVKDTIRPRLQRLFKTSAQVDVEFVADQTGRSPALAMYFGPPLDGARPARLLVNAADPRGLPRYEVMTLMLHEVEPGHHLQTCHMRNLTSLPDFRRYKDDRHYYEAPGRFPLNTAYTEGWGLYAEQLGDELGLFEDPYTELGYCCQNITRAARLVVDTGIHAFGWSRAEAEAYMAVNTPLASKRISNEVIRYITWPGQALAYKIGQLKINEVRKRAEESLGPAFDIKAFHLALLDHGQVPLDFLDTIVDDFISTVHQKE